MSVTHDITSNFDYFVSGSDSDSEDGKKCLYMGHYPTQTSALNIEWLALRGERRGPAYSRKCERMRRQGARHRDGLTCTCKHHLPGSQQ